jgi:hypothetical protein
MLAQYPNPAPAPIAISGRAITSATVIHDFFFSFPEVLTSASPFDRQCRNAHRGDHGD